jgi:hypothetical protein
MADQPSRLEIAVNDVRTELQFFRIALQVFYINVAGNSPQPAAMLAEMRQDVEKAIAKLPVEPQTAQGDQRMKAMVEGHCATFFAQLERLAQEVLASRSGSSATH